MKVDIERVRELKRELAEINIQQLEDIEWYEDGNPLVISKIMVDDWKYVGLNNTEFITTKYYLREEEKDGSHTT